MSFVFEFNSLPLLSLARRSLDANAGSVRESLAKSKSSLADFADLLGTNASYALAPHRDDGNFSESPFLRPVPTGRLVNKSVNIGETFFGSAPDLGAHETPEW